MRRDATGHYSSSLAGVETVRAFVPDLLLFDLDELPSVPFNDVVEVSNHVAALEHGFWNWPELNSCQNKSVCNW